MNFKIERGDGKSVEHQVGSVQEAFILAIPALSVAVRRGIKNTMTCNDEFGNVFRIQTPARKPCVHDGIVREEAAPESSEGRSSATQVCERCTMRTQTTTGSFFNTEQICPDCEAEEKAHPQYQEAVNTEYSAVRRGDLNFKGIGLPDELGQQALRRAGDETSGRR